MTHPFSKNVRVDIEMTMMLDEYAFLSEFLKMLDILPEAIFKALHSDDCERLIRLPNSIYSNMYVNTRNSFLDMSRSEKL